MIGIDVGKGKNNSRVIGYCATINQKMSKFNSNYIFQSSKEYKNNIFEIVSKSLEAYFDYNKSLPTEIIILKNGCSQSQLDYKYDEIEEANQVFNEITNKPKLIYIIADKKPKQKFFLNTKNRTSNPSFGTLVNKKVVGKGYQFFLISQNCNRGTAKPVHYKVLYNNTNFEEGVLEELIFAESFNYMNWTGSIRIPAPLQYAEKLVKFVGEHINKPPETEKLNDHLFYI